MKLSLSMGVLLLACLTVGCGGSEETFDRVAVSGTVTLDGDSSRSGSIIATADIDNGVKDAGRPTTQTLITDGKFEFTTANGPASGDYVFEISLTLPDSDPGAQSADGENESGGEAEMYRKVVTIPADGTESLAVDLTQADRSRGDGSRAMPSSGER